MYLPVARTAGHGTHEQPHYEDTRDRPAHREADKTLSHQIPTHGTNSRSPDETQRTHRQAFVQPVGVRQVRYFSHLGARERMNNRLSKASTISQFDPRIEGTVTRLHVSASEIIPYMSTFRSVLGALYLQRGPPQWRQLVRAAVLLVGMVDNLVSIA